MGLLDAYKSQINVYFSDWIQINDNKSKWTIEDFPYSTGVDENITYPHCWKCVTVNQCWFKNEDNKKPEHFDYSKHTYTQIPKSKIGLYHPNCHCKENLIKIPDENDIEFIIPKGKIEWMIKDKEHTLNVMGYKKEDSNEVVGLLKKLIAQEYINGNYKKREHDDKGFRIGFVLNNFPGKNEDWGKFYKVKTGWSIFPNGKLKCNTLIGGLLK